MFLKNIHIGTVSRRLIILTSIIIAAGFFYFAIHTAVISQRMIKDYYNKTVDNISNEIDKYFVDLNKSLSFVLNLENFPNLPLKTKFQYIFNIFSTSNLYSQLILLDKSDKKMISLQREKEKFYFLEELVKQAREAKTISQFKSYITEKGTPCMDFVYPLETEEVLYITANLTSIWNIFKEFSKLKIYWFTQDGTIVYPIETKKGIYKIQDIKKHFNYTKKTKHGSIVGIFYPGDIYYPIYKGIGSAIFVAFIVIFGVSFVTHSIIEREQLNQENKTLLEQLKELNKIKSYFFDIVIHDLRTPLTAILSLSNFLVRRMQTSNPQLNLTEDIVRKSLETINSSTKIMCKMIDDLLDTSRIEMNRFSINPTLQDYITLIKEMAELEKPKLLSKNMKLNLNIPQKPLVLHIDRDRILRVLTNLIDNSIKYSPSNTQITLNCYMQNSNVITEIIDQGPGIPESELPKVFQRYYRAISTMPKTSGLGLGLSIVAKIIELHNGTIKAENLPIRGLKVTFTLPYVSTLNVTN